MELRRIVIVGLLVVVAASVVLAQMPPVPIIGNPPDVPVCVWQSEGSYRMEIVHGPTMPIYRRQHGNIIPPWSWGPHKNTGHTYHYPGTSNWYTGGSDIWLNGCAVPAGHPGVTAPEDAAHDGRVIDDPAAPVVAYLHDGYLVVYTADGIQWDSFQPGDYEDCPAVNTLIQQTGSGVRLYRLSSCEFQLMAPTQNHKTYILIFGGDAVMSWEEEG